MEAASVFGGKFVPAGAILKSFPLVKEGTQGRLEPSWKGLDSSRSSFAGFFLNQSNYLLMVS